MAIRVDVAVLTGLILQSFLFGVFQVLFAACIYILVTGRNTPEINWRFLTVAILMWIAIGVNFGLSWSRVVDGFIDLQTALPSNPDVINEYFLDLRHWKEIARTAVYVALTAVADTLFIYRLYIIYGRSKLIIILPILLLCGAIVSGAAIDIVIGTTGSGLFGQRLSSPVTSFFAISIVQNVLTTLFIVYRIWRVNMVATGGAGSRTLWPVVVILLESGAIYSATLFVLLCTYVSNSYAQYIVLDMLVPMIGIAFTLIIVRVGLGLSLNPVGGIRRASAASPSASRFGTRPPQKLDITVSRHVTVDRDIERELPRMETKAVYCDEASARSNLEDATDWESKRSMAP